MVELRHLRYFVAVAEELNFRRAAQRLHMAQSPLSQQIRQLERTIGVELIDRPHSVVGLTDAGKVLIEDARRILHSVDEAIERAQRAAAGEDGTLRVGYVGEVTVDLLPLGLKAFKDRHPGVRLELGEGQTGELVDAVRRRQVDVVFARAPWSLEELCYEQLVLERLMVAVPADELEDPGRPRSLEDLDPPEWVMPSQTHAHGLRRDIERAFADRDLEIARRREASSLTATVLLVAGGVGYAIVPASTAHLYPAPGVDYIPLDDEVSTSVGMVWHRHDPSMVVSRFLDVVREIAERYEGQDDVWPGRVIHHGTEPRR